MGYSHPPDQWGQGGEHGHLQLLHFLGHVHAGQVQGDATSNHPQRGPDCGCVERGGWWWVVQGGYSDLTGGWVLGQGGGLKNKAVNQ